MSSQLKPKVAARTDIGLQRKYNEDSIFTFVTPINLGFCRSLLIVADGMGGRHQDQISGKVASQFVIDRIYHDLWDLLTQPETIVEDDVAYERLQLTVSETDRVLNKRPMTDRSIGVSTINCVFIQNDTAIVASIGDSNTYLLRDGQLTLLTEKDELLHPKLFLSGSPRFYLQPLQEGDRLLLCSDGLWAKLSDGEITQHLQATDSSEIAADRLIEAANASGGNDNISAIVCEMMRWERDLNTILEVQAQTMPSPPAMVERNADKVGKGTYRRLKENVDVEELFCTYLHQLIASRFNIDTSLIWSYDLTNLDDETRQDLRKKVKIALASPQDTDAYRFVIGDEENLKETEQYALRAVQFQGLIVLGLLGEKEVIPDLVTLLKENKNTRARTIASGVLLYMTGEDIGSFFMTDADLDLWENWWYENKSV